MYDMKILPLSDALGVEISGVKLDSNLSKAQVIELQDIILRYQVVVFREQYLSEEEQIQVCKQFGPIEPHPLKANTCKHPEIIYKFNEVQSRIRAI